MQSQRRCTWGLLSLLSLLQLSLALRVEPAPSNATTMPVYRVSRPQSKQPAQRVPPHLQDIRPGYVDEDAGDVIRIIEPPPHFQQLKRLQQRQPHPQPQLVGKRPVAVVWEQPRKVSTNRASGDLLTQETQLAAQFANNNQLQLPMEILASVRKTERLLQRQRQPQLPALRQRHIQRQTHTLIAQKYLEQQLQQRGQQQRLRAALLPGHKRSKRVKRQAEGGDEGGSYDVAHGLQLVAHIGELLKNATRYVPDEEPEKTTTNATNRDNRRRRQRLFRLGAKKTPARGRNFRHEATTTTTTTKATTTTTTTATLETTSGLTTSATPLASRLVNSRKSQNNRNQPQPQQLLASPSSVLYADVMATIRNLWQEHDLTAGPQFVAAQQVRNNSDYRALDVYLKELDEIARRLPSVAPITALNQEEFALATPTPNWYLINKEGMIYETRLTSETKPSSTLFHLFPDMPKAKDPITTQDLE
ncbi:uncharacterized protein [Drosophila virilis]|uniref:Uncharacterized protein n=1 Tax=Drosophila virilis TaxID=7244 RepID=B4MFX7_DROVI|nr:uncharacterized protein LOC6636590 [Drosophila virilis]EDW58238.1 uncharacterized protein Dvir_GJ15493 [Drosophila virilis]